MSQEEMKRRRVERALEIDAFMDAWVEDMSNKHVATSTDNAQSEEG
jgi:hypothetical protein